MKVGLSLCESYAIINAFFMFFCTYVVAADHSSFLFTYANFFKSWKCYYCEDLNVKHFANFLNNLNIFWFAFFVP